MVKHAFGTGCPDTMYIMSERALHLKSNNNNMVLRVQGVIFSIECNAEHGLITTTSDDRSVKVWQLTFSTEKQWSQCTVRPLRSFFGHTARVFRSKIICYGKLLIMTAYKYKIMYSLFQTVNPTFYLLEKIKIYAFGELTEHCWDEKT